MWNRIEPRTTVGEFQDVSDAVFPPVADETPMQMGVMEQLNASVIFSTPSAPTDLSKLFPEPIPRYEELPTLAPSPRAHTP